MLKDRRGPLFRKCLDFGKTYDTSRDLLVTTFLTASHETNMHYLCWGTRSPKKIRVTAVPTRNAAG